MFLMLSCSDNNNPVTNTQKKSDYNVTVMFKDSTIQHFKCTSVTLDSTIFWHLNLNITDGESIPLYNILNAQINF